MSEYELKGVCNELDKNQNLLHERIEEILFNCEKLPENNQRFSFSVILLPMT